MIVGNALQPWPTSNLHNSYDSCPTIAKLAAKDSSDGRRLHHPAKPCPLRMARIRHMATYAAISAKGYLPRMTNIFGIGHWLLLTCCCVVMLHGLSVAHAADSSCPASYRPAADAELPLLFGGVLRRCSSGCQSRKDEWSLQCNPLDLNGSRTCELQQTNGVMQAARDALGLGPEHLTPCQLHSYLKHRTLWLIGDSHMKHQYHALRCFLLDLWDHSLGECAVSSSSTVAKALWQAADTNHTSVLLGLKPKTDVPKCIHLLGGGRICRIQSVRGEEFAAGPTDPEAPALLQVLQDSLAQPEDIFLLNFGRWHFHNCVGLQVESYTHSLVELGSFYQRTRARFPNMVFKVSAHDHTECDAAGNMLEPVTQCVPAGQGHYPLSIGRCVMESAVNVLGRYNMSLMNDYQLSLQMYQAHTLNRYADGTGDCNHWCTPGLQELEIWSLYEVIRSHPTMWPVLGGRQQGSAAVRRQSCVPITSDHQPADWLGGSSSSSSSSLLGSNSGERNSNSTNAAVEQ